MDIRAITRGLSMLMSITVAQMRQGRHYEMLANRFRTRTSSTSSGKSMDKHNCGGFSHGHSAIRVILIPLVRPRSDGFIRTSLRQPLAHAYIQTDNSVLQLVSLYLGRMIWLS